MVKISEEHIRDYADEVSDCAFDYLMKYGVDISPVVKNESHFNYWVENLPYYRNVRDEGVVIRAGLSDDKNEMTDRFTKTGQVKKTSSSPQRIGVKEGKKMYADGYDFDEMNDQIADRFGWLPAEKPVAIGGMSRAQLDAELTKGMR
jgi:hypothetical protein